MTEIPEDVDPELMQEILERIFDGQKIQAIKLYKESQSVSLKAAKEFVEELTVKLQEEHPDRFSAQKQPSGCFGVLLLALIFFGWQVYSIARFVQFT
ncbi:MAG: hypothetical protein AAF483_19150 [Planctomycetota bacterium]